MATAPAHFAGVVSQGPATSPASNRKGIVSADLVAVDYGAIPAALAGGIINGASAQLPAAAGTVTFTPDTDGTAPLNAATRPAVVNMTDPVTSQLVKMWDLGVAVALVGTVTHGSSVVAGTVLMAGLDEYRSPMTESVAITAGTTSKAITGKKAFRYLRSVSFTSAANATTNTLTLATSNVYGVPVKIDAVTDLLSARMDSGPTTVTIVTADVTSPATPTTGDVRGTVVFATPPNGTQLYSVLVLANRSGQVSTLGVTQA